MAMQHVKICIVGSDNSGKTSLAHTLIHGEFPSQDQMTKYFKLSSASYMDSSSKIVYINGRSVNVSIWDTYSASDYNRLRPLSYPQTDIFLICMNISSTHCFDADNEIKAKWIPEIKRHVPRSQIILIETKSDLRDVNDNNNKNNKTPFISIEDCKTLCDDVEASMYVEIAAKYMNTEDIDKLLKEIVSTHSLRYIRRQKGYRLPKNAVIPNASNNDEDLRKLKLLIAGYSNEKNSEMLIPAEICNIIFSFCYYRKIFSYHSTKAMSFGSNEKLKCGFYTMYWMDLAMVIFHNICWLYFAIEVWTTFTSNSNMGIAALVFSLLESMIIIISHILMWTYSEIQYYTEHMLILYISMECVVNLPMVIILFIYLFTTQTTLIVSFYVAFVMYLLHGLYRYGIVALVWGDKNSLYLHEYYGLCTCLNTLIWMLAMISLIVIGSVYVAQNTKRDIAITLLVISSVGCCIIAFLGYLHVILTGIVRHYHR